MPVESEADRAVFTNANDFGVIATYQPKAGQPVAVAVIFDNNSISVDPGGMAVSTVDPHCEVRSSLLPGGGVAGDTILIGAITYTIRDVNADGTGMTRLELHR